MAADKNEYRAFFYSENIFDTYDIAVAMKNYAGTTFSHWHDHFELELFLSGTGVFFIGDTEYQIAPGSCYMVAPADFHKLSATSPMKIFNIAFNDRALSREVYETINTGIQGQPILFSPDELAFIEPLIDKTIEVSKNDNELFPLRNRALADLCELITIMYIKRCERSENIDKPVSKIVKQTISYIKYNFKNKITLQSVAATIPISPNYLGAKFNEEIGMSFNAYLMQIRLTYAHSLLKSDQFAVEDVAHASGFSTASYFSDCFRKHYGYSPLEMKKILSSREKGKTVFGDK